MSQLTDRLEQAASDLDNVTTGAKAASMGLPSITRKFYESFAPWPQEIREAIKLLDVRTTALQQLRHLCDPTRHCPNNPENVIFNETSIPYWHARLICFQSYLAITWAIYDTLSQICGRLSLNELQAKDQTTDLNLLNILTRHKGELKPDGIGFWFASQLRETYGWPIAFSYACRNWFTHEGQFHDGTKFFERDDRGATPYRVNAKALEQILDRCSEKYSTEQTQMLGAGRLPKPEDDFPGYLEICHQEVDDCIGLLTSWTCASAKLQATLLLKRHVSAGAASTI